MIAVLFLFLFLLCPETGGKTLELVDCLFVVRGVVELRKDFGVDVEGLADVDGKDRLVERRDVVIPDVRSLPGKIHFK